MLPAVANLWVKLHKLQQNIPCQGWLSLFKNDTFLIPTHIPVYHKRPMTWLLFYILAVSLYDLRTNRIPNWCTYPLILAGMIAHFPGHIDLWLACFLLLSAWASGGMGAGDVKLWMAVLWAMPLVYLSQALPFMFASFFITSLMQLFWRAIRRQPAVNVKNPAAWRALFFLLLCWYVH